MWQGSHIRHVSVCGTVRRIRRMRSQACTRKMMSVSSALECGLWSQLFSRQECQAFPLLCEALFKTRWARSGSIAAMDSDMENILCSSGVL